MEGLTMLGVILVVMGLGLIALGLRARFAQHATRIMPIRNWRILSCLSGLGGALMGLALTTQQRPPLFGMSLSSVELIGFVAGVVAMLAYMSALVFYISYDPTMAAIMGIPLWLRRRMHGNNPLLESPDQPPAHD